MSVIVVWIASDVLVKEGAFFGFFLVVSVPSLRTGRVI